MTDRAGVAFPRRIYPLDPRKLSQEQLAVVFAMTSRQPQPFDQTAQRVSTEKAADFHERWVVGYGHASVAEHAVLHMAVENISRLACDALEDNRLAAYTEKSTRYQVLEPGYYYLPPELEAQPDLQASFKVTCDRLFATYLQLVEGCKAHLQRVRPRREGERDTAYDLRLRREAVDSCRFILPAATLTNVGVTMNARSLEHAITKLLSSDLQEEREVGQLLKEEGRKTAPTLIKYANESPYLVGGRGRLAQLSDTAESPFLEPTSEVRLIDADPQAEQRIVAALLYRHSHRSYAQVWEQVQGMSASQRDAVLDAALAGLGPFDAPPRELELASVTLELVMDYGAYREFKRHRMQTYLPQPLTVVHGAAVPTLLQEAGLATLFQEGTTPAEAAFHRLAEFNPRVAQYVVTHAHRRRVLARMDLRECFHLFKLRTGPQAHFSIREVMEKALALCQAQYPALFRYFQRRDR